MALTLLTLSLGFAAGALASFIGTAAGAVACDVFLLGAAAGLIVVRDPGAARIAAFPKGPAFGFAVLGVAAVGAAAGLPVEIAVLPIAASGVLLGRLGQAAVFHLGVQGVPRRIWTASLVAGVVAAPFALAAAGHVSELFAVAVAGATPLVFALLTRTASAESFDLPAPRREGAVAGMPTLVFVPLIGAGFARVVDGSAASFLWIGAGAVLAALLAPRARRSGVVLGGCALLTVGFLGLALGRAPETPWLADSGLRVAVASVLFGAGVVGLPRLYAVLPPAGKILARLEEQDRVAPDGAVRRVGMLLVGLVIGRTPWMEQAAPWMVFSGLAIGGAGLVWFDPRAGIARRAKVLVVAGAVAGVGLWLVREVG